jgi:hypothetical protein
MAIWFSSVEEEQVFLVQSEMSWLTDNRILVVREARTHRATGTVRRQIVRDDACKLVLDVFGRRRESLALQRQSAYHDCSTPNISFCVEFTFLK